MTGSQRTLVGLSAAHAVLYAIAGVFMGRIQAEQAEYVSRDIDDLAVPMILLLLTTLVMSVVRGFAVGRTGDGWWYSLGLTTTLTVVDTVLPGLALLAGFVVLGTVPDAAFHPQPWLGAFHFQLFISLPLVLFARTIAGKRRRVGEPQTM